MKELRYDNGELAKWYYSRNRTISDGSNEYYLLNKAEVELEDGTIIFGSNQLLDKLNKLTEENQRLKAQLTADIDGVCSLCNHHYLVKDKVMQGFYTGKCEKGHEKASKEAVKYCEDFDLKVKE